LFALGIIKSRLLTNSFKTNILTKPCAVEAGAPNYSGIATIDANGDASSQLTVIVDDMVSFFNEFLVNCNTPRKSDGKTTLEVKVDKIEDWELRLADTLLRAPAN